MFRRVFKIKNLLFVPLLLIVVFLLMSLGPVFSKDETEYGVTFSYTHAKSLGLDWQETYLATLEELNVKKLRLPAYWNEIELKKGEYHWEELDWQIKTAKEHDAEVILAVGNRLPRWPECHTPDWAKNLPESEREAKILDYIKSVIGRYQGMENIIAWQVENEPFLGKSFGECPSLNTDALDREIALVHALDARPIVITDSGELSAWVPAASRADIFGTTMYRDTYSNILKSYIHYPITPAFFKFKRNFAKLLSDPNPVEWLVIELQAEPWGPISYREMSPNERDRTMSIDKFRDIIEFARLTGFKTFYLWGVEWWYWEREHNNNPVFWEYAKEVYGHNLQ